MNTAELIAELKRSPLRAVCPRCEGAFRLKDTILFDGTKPFPAEALEAQTRLKDELKEREDELARSKKSARTNAAVTAKAVNIGKSVEKILPLMKDFKWALPDCRFLADPIDLLTFNGCTKNRIESISFIEIKTGNAKLTPHQKAIKEAIEDKNVSYKVYQ